ncbi:hypothetical protein SC979_09275 [Legionella pneumophila serogroup 1]
MDENYVAYKLEADDVGLKGRYLSEGILSLTIKEVRQKIDQTSKNGGWIIFKKNGNLNEPYELYKP